MRVLTLGLLCLIPLAAQPQRLPAAPQRPAAAAPDAKVRYIARWDPQQSGLTDRLHAVHFVNTKSGWAVGDHNIVLRTSDGGDSWKLLTERQERGDQLESVVFVNDSEGWVQSTKTLLHTTDGGQSWQPANELPRGGGFGGACMVGKVRYQLKVHNMGVGVYRTADGGNTWQALPAELPRNDYTTLFFVDEQHGWVSGDYGRFAMTDDGGRTWKEKNLDGGNLHRLQFLSPQHGWLLPRAGKAGPMVTSDGGVTWTNQYAGLPTYRTMHVLQFLNESNGFLLADEAVLHTSNGGKSWTTIGKPHLGLGLSFPQVDEGWVVGDKGVILHYHLVPAPGQ